MALAARFNANDVKLIPVLGWKLVVRTSLKSRIKLRHKYYSDEGRPNATDLLKAGAVQLVVYTTTGAVSFEDEKQIRRNAVTYRVPCITTLSGARAAAEALASRHRDPIRVWSLQGIHTACV